MGTKAKTAITITGNGGNKRPSVIENLKQQRDSAAKAVKDIDDILAMIKEDAKLGKALTKIREIGLYF